jgi:hypothetical protein
MSEEWRHEFPFPGLSSTKKEQVAMTSRSGQYSLKDMQLRRELEKSRFAYHWKAASPVIYDEYAFTTDLANPKEVYHSSVRSEYNRFITRS